MMTLAWLGEDAEDCRWSPDEGEAAERGDTDV